MVVFFRFHIVIPYSVCLSLSDLFHLAMSCKSIHVAANRKMLFFLYGWVVLHFTYTHTYTHVCVCMCVRMRCKSPQSCLTLCSLTDRSQPGSSVHGILQGSHTGVGCPGLLQGDLHIHICIYLTASFFNFYFFKLWKYDNTFTGDLENTEQSYL